MTAGAAVERTIGGIPARELAQQYGTPLFLIDLDVLDLELDGFVRACAPHGIAVAYAGKAFLCAALAEHFAATPLRLDVCSLGELITAERGGFPPGRMYFHGCGKSDAELRSIVERRVAFDVVDNHEELTRLAAIAPSDEPVDVMLRINTGIEAHTHAFVRTGGENTKFGFARAELPAVLRRVAALPMLRVIGLHSHIGSQIEEAAPFLANLDELLAGVEQARALGLPVAEAICGGGIAVPEGFDDPHPLELAPLAAALAARANGTQVRLSLEPGRALIARAGTSLYQIMAVKTQGGRRFVVVDGGMADNPRPIIYGARHRPEVMSAQNAGALMSTTLAGRSCENDEMGDYELPAGLAAGDLLALRTTGAYTYSMASNYNRFGRPAVVFVRDGHHRRVIRGESPEDVTERDLV